MLPWGLWLIHFLLVCQLLAEQKVWTPRNSLDDIANWELSSFPGACDRLLLTKADDATVLMSLNPNFAVKSIVLPRQGVFQFQGSTSLKLTSDKQCSSTISRDAIFAPTSSKEWLDPANWETVEGGKITTGWQPHMNFVPCYWDSVVFKNITNDVTLPSVLVPYKDVTINEKIMGAESWRQYLTSDAGLLNFRGSPDVRSLKWRMADASLDSKHAWSCASHAYTIRDWSYQDVNRKVLEDAICSFARRRCEAAEAPRCRDPVHPEGHCCGVCGAIIDFEENTSSMALLETELLMLVASVVAEEDVDLKIPFYIGWTETGSIQLVLIAPDGDVLRTYSMSQTIINSLKNKFGLSSKVHLQYSGVSYEYSLAGPTMGAVFGTLIFMISLFATIYYIYMVLPGRSLSGYNQRDPFSFARFRNKLHSTTSNDTLSFEAAEVVAASTTSEAFVNPLFNTGEPEHAAAHLMTEKMTEVDDSVANLAIIGSEIAEMKSEPDKCSKVESTDVVEETLPLSVATSEPDNDLLSLSPLEVKASDADDGDDDSDNDLLQY